MGFDSPLGDKKKNDEMSATKRHIKLLLLLAAGLLAGCVREDPPTPETQEEIRLDATVWQMMQGAPARTMTEDAPLRAMTYDAGTLTSGSFTAAAYVANTTTPYINPVTVNWETDKWVWSDGKHYWPASGNLDFFAYMPATKPSYISSITYAVAGEPAAPAPYFVCADFPMTTAGQNVEGEFVYALTTGQNKTTPGSSGVTMTFMHPFAKIKFQLSSATTTNVTVNSITMEGLVTSGTCSFNGTTSTWTSQSGSATMTLTEALQRYETEGTSPLLMIPNNYGSKNLSVNVTWTEWDEVHTQTYSTPLTINWAAGNSYTYNLTITRNELIVDVAKYTEQW